MNRFKLPWWQTAGGLFVVAVFTGLAFLLPSTVVVNLLGYSVAAAIPVVLVVLAAVAWLAVHYAPKGRDRRLTVGGAVFAWSVVAVCSLYLIGQMVPRRDPEGQPALTKFGNILVLDGGRVKPLDTFARVHLMALNRRQTYTDENKTRQQAVRWVVNLLGMGVLRPSGEMTLDSDVAKYFGLPEPDGGTYALEDVRDAIAAKAEDLNRIRMADREKLKPTERKALVAAMVANARAGIREAARDAMKKTGRIDRANIFRIDNDQVLAMLGLPMREGLRYSQDDIIDPAKRDLFNQFFKKALAARERDEKSRDLVDVKSLELLTNLRTHTSIMDLEGVAFVPGETVNDFTTLSAAFNSGEKRAEVDSITKMLGEYVTGDVKGFNTELDKFLESQEKAFPAEVRTAKLEAWFNSFAPFYQCANLYALVFVLAVLSFAVYSDALSAAAFRVCAVVVAVHTFALILRMVIQQRPPVTNLYSSAVFIGWGCVLLGLWCDYLYRNGVGTAVASILGFTTMIIAHHLGGSGDTLEMMQAVLDTNFWLATHVTTVTLGYTATFVAGFIAIVLVYGMFASTIRHAYLDREPMGPARTFHFFVAVLGVVGLPVVGVVGLIFGLWALWMEGDSLPPIVGLIFSLPAIVAAFVVGLMIILRRMTNHGARPGVMNTIDKIALTGESSKALTGLIYGVVCFATLLSFVGTVLGGIWADQSWGRFWGWDPKENGALLIVIMNAMILHARWAGMIKERGLAMMAIAGNMVTAWSWFGTNQLGVGLHAYGLNSTLADGCALFWMSQLALIGLACLPLRNYRMYAPSAAEQEAEAPPSVSSRAGAKIAGRMAKV